MIDQTIGNDWPLAWSTKGSRESLADGAANGRNHDQHDEAR
jgi:hypothetical protein